MTAKEWSRRGEETEEESVPSCDENAQSKPNVTPDVEHVDLLEICITNGVELRAEREMRRMRASEQCVTVTV